MEGHAGDLEKPHNTFSTRQSRDFSQWLRVHLDHTKHRLSSLIAHMKGNWASGKQVCKMRTYNYISQPEEWPANFFYKLNLHVECRLPSWDW